MEKEEKVRRVIGVDMMFFVCLRVPPKCGESGTRVFSLSSRLAYFALIIYFIMDIIITGCV
jgi:hypothetical protein